MEKTEALEATAKALQISLKSNDFAVNKQLLADRINDLILEDFEKLVTILYRTDVSEEKVRRLLQDNPGIAAGHIIAELIIERQLQKIKSRREFKQRDDDIDEDEKW